MKDEKPPTPTRGRGAGGGDDGADDEDDGEDVGGGGGAAFEDLVDRVDVGAKFEGAIITELADKNWKVPIMQMRDLHSCTNFSTLSQCHLDVVIDNL